MGLSWVHVHMNKTAQISIGFINFMVGFTVINHVPFSNTGQLNPPN